MEDIYFCTVYLGKQFTTKFNATCTIYNETQLSSALALKQLCALKEKEESSTSFSNIVQLQLGHRSTEMPQVLMSPCIARLVCHNFHVPLPLYPVLRY